MCNIPHNSKDDQKMKRVEVIIWDEITITSKNAFEALDKEILGGKVVIVSDNF